MRRPSFRFSRRAGYLASRSGAPSVNPDAVSGLQGWWDADHYSTGTFTDQSGNGRDLTQATEAAQPTLNAADLNGHATVTFDGSDDLVQGAAISNFISATTYYVYAVFNVASIANNSSNGYENDGLIGDVTQYFGIYLRNNGPTAIAYNYAASEQDAVASISTGQWIIVTTKHVGGQISIATNGTFGTAETSGDTGVLTGAIQIGRGNGSAAFYNGKFAEAFIYNADVGSTSHSALVQYLRNKYGL